MSQKAGRPLKSERNKRMAKAYEKGLSYRQVATRFGVAVATAHKIITREMRPVA